MTLRIAYLATADARGHLMRCQLLAHALQARGVQVAAVTTSDDGVRFLAGFGIEASLLSRHYAVQFDPRQNMLREATDANVANYVFRPSRMLRDILRLRAVFRSNDLVVNDSFHPALLFMGCLPGWRRKVVHVYGATLREALQTNFSGRLPGWMAKAFSRIVAWQIDAARARLAHGFAFDETTVLAGRTYRVATPVAVVAQAGLSTEAAVYLNPHFRDPAMAAALEHGLSGAGLPAHRVGEGFEGRPGWVGQDAQWVARAAGSGLIVSAPGMAALSIARVYRRPILLVLTDQPEQQRNAAHAADLGLLHRCVVWRGDAADFAEQTRVACEALMAAAVAGPTGPAGHATAAARLGAWVSVLTDLAGGREPAAAA